jgi:protein-L-isoaspartate(D-aspartate) O-methyltransferase
MKVMRRRVALLLLALAAAASGAVLIWRELVPGRDAVPTAAAGAAEDGFEQARARMVQGGIVAWGITNSAVIEAMGRVPRHLYVPEEYLDQAYENHPLPIGFGQTISQPYIVALMTESLQVEPGDKVLEIGTGSGYQAAVLAEVGAEVFTIEIIEPLAEAAAERLGRLGYSIHARAADGYYGWPEEAPFDAIIVTAAPDHIPQPLLAQLAVGGVLVIPIGPPGGYQELWSVTRTGPEDFATVSLGGVRFVPLVHPSSGFIPEE